MNQPYQKTEPSRREIDSLPAVVIEFGTPWCGHCRAAQPLIEKALQKHPRLPHIKIEDGRGRPLGRAFAVKLWPTLIFLQHGKEVERLVRPADQAAIEAAAAKIDI